MFLHCSKTLAAKLTVIWKVGEAPIALAASQLASEQQLEVMIVRDPRILTGYLLAGGYFG